jgi:hypothetical protein
MDLQVTAISTMLQYFSDLRSRINNYGSPPWQVVELGAKDLAVGEALVNKLTRGWRLDHLRQG